jgi:hypothetical protein
MVYLNANMSRLGIPGQKVSALQTLVTQYQTAQNKAILPNAGKADRLVRNERAKEIEKAARNFVNTYLRYNEALTDEDRVNFGMVVPDEEPTPESEIVTIPVVDLIDTSVLRRVGIRFKDMDEAKSHAIPEFAHGAEIRWNILDATPASVNDLIHSEFSTRTHYALTFDESQRGKTVWFCLRWENNRGQKGPWGEIYSAVIP